MPRAETIRNEFKENLKKESGDARARMVFESGQIKITERQDDAFRNAFRHVDFPEAYERMAAWLVANPQKLEKPGMFIYRWLANIPAPVPEPAGLDIPAAERSF